MIELLFRRNVIKPDVAGHDICFPFRAHLRFVANVAVLNSPSPDGSLRTDDGKTYIMSRNCVLAIL